MAVARKLTFAAYYVNLIVIGVDMGKRGPKPTREPTTHIRVPVSLAEALRKAAIDRDISIATLFEDMKDKMLGMLPMPPKEGPPLPRKLGVRWPRKTEKGE